MSRSPLPGVTVYQSVFTTKSVLARSNRNGLSEAASEVWPEYEWFSTAIWAFTIVCIRVRSLVVSVWSEMTWKTVRMCTDPSGIRGASLMTPYAFAWLSG